MNQVNKDVNTNGANAASSQGAGDDPLALVSGIRQQGDAMLASLRGEIDLHNSPDLRLTMLDTLLRANPRKIILNLLQVPYMDSSALAVLVEGMQRLRKIGGKMYLTNLQPRVRGLLEIARLHTIFVLAKDEADALAH